MDRFKSVILQEEAPPCGVENCKDCGLYTHGSRVIWGEGNPHGPLFAILDNPGAREDREGKAFLCGTRGTLQIGIQEAGMHIESFYISYLLKRRPRRAYDKEHARAACLQHLHQQLMDKKPKLLIGFGNVVIQTLISQETDVKSNRGKWLEYNGFPIAFSYHPLAVRRRPALMKYFVEDLSQVAAKYKELEEQSAL